MNRDTVKLSTGEAIRAGPAEGQEGTRKCVWCSISSSYEALYEWRWRRECCEKLEELCEHRALLSAEFCTQRSGVYCT